jgi:hypothetical protein
MEKKSSVPPPPLTKKKKSKAPWPFLLAERKINPPPFTPTGPNKTCMRSPMFSVRVDT